MELVIFRDLFGKELHINSKRLAEVDVVEHDEAGEKPCIRLFWFDSGVGVQVADHMDDVLIEVKQAQSDYKYR